MIYLWLNYLRYWWSAIRYYKSPQTTEVRVDLIPVSFSDIPVTVSEVYSRFTYTQDGLAELFDAMDSPAGAWERTFKQGLRDDCDGFHAALYWALHHNFTCYLLTIATIKIIDSHTLICFEYKGKIHYIDYTYISKGYDNISEVITAITKQRKMAKVLSVATANWRVEAKIYMKR